MAFKSGRPFLQIPGPSNVPLFRIGHLGDFNDLTLMGTLAGVEMGLHDAGVQHRQGGVAAAMDVLANRRDKAAKAA